MIRSGCLRGEHGQDRARQDTGLMPERRRRAICPAERTADYTDLMANSQPLVAGEILDAYPLESASLPSRCRGRGRQLSHRGRAALRAARADPVRSAGGCRSERPSDSRKPGFGARLRALGGDFCTIRCRRAPMSLSLVRVVHDHDDDGGAIAAACGTPCARRRRAFCCWPSRCWGHPEPRRSATLISGSTSSPWVMGGRARPSSCKLMLTEAGFSRVATGAHAPAPADPPHRRPQRACVKCSND